MCTLVILRRPGHAWPLLVAANRDEMKDRAWRPPGRHWPTHPRVVAGRDELAGGSWLGLNDAGVVAGVLNRVASLGPAAGKRSRGELVLGALEHDRAASAAAAVGALSPNDYRSFNLVVADRDEAYWLRNRNGEPGSADAERIKVFPLPSGLSMITAHDRNDTASARIRTHLPRFVAAPAPDPDRDDWRAWQSILASRSHAPDDDAFAAMSLDTPSGFGTVSSSLLALPAPGASVGPPRGPLWLFAPGPPDRTPYERVAL